MKNSNRNILVIILLIFVISYTACVPDKDDPALDREKFIGDWLATETSTLHPTPISFNVTISENAGNIKQVYISNFYHFGWASTDRVLANVNGNSIIIEPQTVCNNIVNGSGILSDNKINWSYNVNDGADIDKVTSVYKK